MPTKNNPRASITHSSIFNEEAYSRSSIHLAEKRSVGFRKGMWISCVTKSLGGLLVLGAGMLFGQSSAYAQRTTWTGGSASWNNPANWSGGAPTSSTSGTAVINNNVNVAAGSGVSGSYDYLYVGNASGGGGAVTLAGGELTGTIAYFGSAALSSGTAIVTSGTWTSPTGSLIFGGSGQGVLNMSGGLISTYGGTFGNSTGGSGSASMTGGIWNLSGELKVGASGTGSFLLNGGNVTAGYARFGDGSGGVGTGTVSSGTLSVAGMIVGNQGKGTLTINGGTVASTGGFFLGNNTTGDGTVIVSSGSFGIASGQTVVIGNTGKAAFEVNGGTFDSKSSLTVANSASSVASITVTSGTFSTSSTTMGKAGVASLTVSGGVFASTGGINLASDVGSETSVTLTSGTLSSSNTFALAQSGSASVVVTGGLLKASGITLASGSGSGTLTVSGGSVDASTGSVTIAQGSNSTGVVEISENGLVKGRVVVGSGASSNGTLKLLGNEDARGSLETTQIIKNAGTASFQWDGGVVKATANASNLITGFAAGEISIGNGGAYIDSQNFNITVRSSMEGSGSLTKHGTGALTISASNSYSGGTTLEAGSIVADANNALGTGAVTVKSGTLSVSTGVTFGNAVTLEGGHFKRAIAASGSLADSINITGSIDGVTTGARILGGISSAVATVDGSFSSTSSARNDEHRVGNVFHLSGVNVRNAGTGETDIFVLELAVADLTGKESLGWLDTTTNLWDYAVNGNIGGTAVNLGDKAFDAGTDFVLGYYGIDRSKGTVWAVINHNSDFAAVPEPGTWALLVLGGGALLGLRKRRSGSRGA